jgi:pimeloyl-ACP methyl ester carboxylesterase
VNVRRAALTLAIAAVIGATATLPVRAEGDVGHTAPQGPAAVRFAADFPTLVDSEWGFTIGGFGGIHRRAPREHVPVIFVHGNTVDHADWYPVRDDFRAAGWSDQELWALSYNGLGGNNGSGVRMNPERDAEHQAMGWDGAARVTANEVNMADLYAFIKAVQRYTGSTRFSLVTHSLGVTVARETLRVHRELRRHLVAFVGIAGGNHGTSLCPPGAAGTVYGCDELEQGSAWLARLNGPGGRDETYGRTRWMTIYDGSGACDLAYVSPQYASSPVLAGADNRTFLKDHNSLRISEETVAIYRAFLESAE